MLFSIIVISTIIYVLYKLTTYRFNLENKFGFPGPKPLPLLGNILEILKYGFHVADVRNQKLFGHIYPIYFGQTPMLIVSDDAILRQILVKEAKSFIDRPRVSGIALIMKQNLLNLKGKDWERVRTLVTPTFTSGKLKKMSPMMVASVNEMIKRFKNSEKKDIDIKEIFGSLTMDVIAKTMFGMEIDFTNTSSNSFIKHAKLMTSLTFSNVFFIMTLLFPQLSKIVEYFYPKGIRSPESIVFFEKSLASTIELRRNSKEESHDFLDLMIKASNEIEIEGDHTENKTEIHSYKSLTANEITAQSILFLLAGYETTSSVLTFCSYYLAMNPDIQDEVYQELIENVTDEKQITYEILSNLNLLEQCLNETLRICPPVPRFARACTQDIILTSSTGQTLRATKGMQFTVPVYAIHHDERIWPDPDVFDIHRFDPEVKQNRSPFAFLPFGSGPRVCIGQRFALLEAKLALAHLLINYKIKPCHQTPKKLIFGASGLTSVKEPVIVRIEKRQ